VSRGAFVPRLEARTERRRQVETAECDERGAAGGRFGHTRKRHGYSEHVGDELGPTGPHQQRRARSDQFFDLANPYS
jgi:hypothetical protein